MTFVGSLSLLFFQVFKEKVDQCYGREANRSIELIQKRLSNDNIMSEYHFNEIRLDFFCLRQHNFRSLVKVLAVN